MSNSLKSFHIFSELPTKGEKMRKITIVDHGRHDMYEITMEYKSTTIAGASLINVIERIIREFADDDFRKMKKIADILEISEFKKGR